MGESRGCISFFATYRPPVAMDIYSCPYPQASPNEELQMTDGKEYNYNGHSIPPSALKKMLEHPKLADHGKAGDVDSGRLTGLLFVSERTEGLETLHIAFRFNDNPVDVKIFNFAEVYGTCGDARLEDTGCFAGDYLVYVTTKDDPKAPHQPWNAVYKTHLVTGVTTRLTPEGTADLNPAVSPNGKKIAVASFQDKEGGWCGGIEDLETNIFVYDLDQPKEREPVVSDGGWPTWGSDELLFFHRNIEKVEMQKRWGVFRVNIDEGEDSVIRVTPDNLSAITPAAIDDTKVAVATIRESSKFGMERSSQQYRHVEVFEVSVSGPREAIERISVSVREKADHFNPFVVKDVNGKLRIGYHRCKITDNIDEFAVVETKFRKIKSPEPEVGVFRVSGVFPTFSPDGSKLAFVDNEFRAVWVADSVGLRAVYEMQGPDSVFSPVWNQNPKKDLLYICKGPSFNASQKVQICEIPVASSGNQRRKELTKKFNNAFPSTNPEGTKLVYRSNRDGPKNLYIMEDASVGEWGSGKITRLTEGAWTDTHCQWSPNGDWIVFSSNRANPTAPKKKDLPDPGYFGVYLINAKAPGSNAIKVIDSGVDYNGDIFPGHVNHPYFSPDGKSLVVASDMAAISCDPISLPLFSHSVRPYGDIFTVDLDMDDIEKNKDLKKFTRTTHSRYENSTATWTMYSSESTTANWNDFLDANAAGGRGQGCPYIENQSGGESFIVTGHLHIPRRCC